jgi:hypothetical protein
MQPRISAETHRPRHSRAEARVEQAHDHAAVRMTIWELAVVERLGDLPRTIAERSRTVRNDDEMHCYRVPLWLGVLI